MTEVASIRWWWSAAGPAGLAAAAAAGEMSGRRAGGLARRQRGAGRADLAAGEGRALCRRRGGPRKRGSRAAGVVIETGVGGGRRPHPAGRRLPAARRTRRRQAFACRAGRLVLATGALERFLPFPGWTLPGVYGAGGLQALYKGGFALRRQTHPGGRQRTACCWRSPRPSARPAPRVPAIVEQAPRAAVLALRRPAAAPPAQAGAGTRARPFPAAGAPALRRLAAAGRRRGPARAGGGRPRPAPVEVFPCDYLACGFGLAPSLPLARLLGCDDRGRRPHGGRPARDQHARRLRGRRGARHRRGRPGRGRRPHRRPRRRRRRGRRTAAPAAAARRRRLRRRPRPGLRAARGAARSGRRPPPSSAAARTSPGARSAAARRPATPSSRPVPAWGPARAGSAAAPSSFLAGYAPDAVRPPLFPVSCGVLAELSRLAAEALSPENASHPRTENDERTDLVRRVAGDHHPLPRRRQHRPRLPRPPRRLAGRQRLPRRGGARLAGRRRHLETAEKFAVLATLVAGGRRPRTGDRRGGGPLDRPGGRRSPRPPKGPAAAA